MYELREEYFNWLYSLVNDDRFSKRVSYKKLLRTLHSIDFLYFISNDDNRAEDGINLRQRFSSEKGYRRVPIYIDGACSVLEMMIALSLRCEDQIMYDPDQGNRTGQWFWNMITNLGLGSMTDNRFNEKLVIDHVYIFMERKYKENGEGGLFTLNHPRQDLRTVEIWYQMCWYLNELMEA